MSALTASLFFALALGCAVLVAIGMRLLAADIRLRDRLSDNDPGAGQGALRLPLPRIFLARGRDRNEIEGKLKDAGFFDSKALDRFVWLRLVATAVLAALAFAALRGMGATAFITSLGTFIAGGSTYLGAKYVLHTQAAKRERRLSIEFPFLLDLMLMMLESGVSLDQCFRSISRDERVAVPHHGALLAMLVDDLDRGLDYQTTFDRWASRVGVFGAKELATLFRQSLFQGMELAPALREFITEFSQRRVARARESIGKITVKMVFLMLIFFMPALFIVLAGPPVAAILDTLGGNAP
jgi:tight adherence protein C